MLALLVLGTAAVPAVALQCGSWCMPARECAQTAMSCCHPASQSLDRAGARLGNACACDHSVVDPSPPLASARGSYVDAAGSSVVALDSARLEHQTAPSATGLAPSLDWRPRQSGARALALLACWRN